MQITETAIQHFRDLLAKEENPGMNLRIYVANPFTPHAEIGLTFCPKGEEEKTDEYLDFKDFLLYIAEDSRKALKNAEINFIEDTLGGQLSIKAPGLRGHSPGQEASLEERIKYVLDAEINPTLAGHGGRVALIEILNDETVTGESDKIESHKTEAGKIVVLQFGGGCHGCGMANVTLKNGIEKTLKEKFPEILEVRDITNHASGTNPYYTKTETESVAI